MNEPKTKQHDSSAYLLQAINGERGIVTAVALH